MADRAPHDQNLVSGLLAASNADGVTPVALWADPSTHALVTSGGGTGGSGTQYAELLTTAPATGTVALGRYKLAAPTLTDGQLYGLQLDVSGNLKVTGTTTVTQATAANLNATVIGTGTFAVQADTELPAAATLADSTANPTVPGVGSFNQLWDANATTWARQAAWRHGINVGANTGISAVALMAEFDDVSPVTTTENQVSALRLSSNRNLYGTIRDAAGNERGVNVNASNQLSVSVDNPVGTPAFTTLTPNTTGGWSVSSQTALTNTKTAVKASAGTFGGYMIYNPNATVVHIQIWNVVIGSITVGTTAPTYVLSIPATSSANLELTNGVNHSAEINVAATTTPTGSTAPGSAVVAAFFYK